MASIFMRIDGINTIKGAATVTEIGNKKGFFALDHVSWEGNRGVGINIGNANNADKGMAALGQVKVRRQSDGASPYLTSFLFSPGAEGKTIEIVMTKPNRTGAGMDPYLVITLEKSRMSHYNIECRDGELPTEEYDLTYTTISKVYYQETEGGTIEKGDTVKFDTTTAQLESKAAI
ncbi:type VI secretion system tube protein Hcp [Marinobacterium jannaschii]|uniref:type VI secretion system tube protein Hcp n=1 Tax=Marinobacterium jannaschii TaxID=64970 RepID=UPI000484A91D|nr:type VI secretion system tube protein Hcp [Marinobacterium jannaschii]